MQKINTLSPLTTATALADTSLTQALSRDISKSLMVAGTSLVMWLTSVLMSTQLTINEVKWALSYNVGGWAMLLFAGSMLVGFVALAMTRGAMRRVHHHALIDQELSLETERRLRRTGRLAQLLVLPAAVSVMLCTAYLCYLLGGSLTGGVIVGAFITFISVAWIRQS